MPAALKQLAKRIACLRGFRHFRTLLFKISRPEQLTTYASQLGMDSSDFKKCLDSGKFKAAVQKDEDEASRLGIQGTPAFVINGQLLSGAQPESEFARIIDAELNKRAQR